ncbi:MAG: hypothetical protein ACOYMS_11435 [Terrimicrobiaceae bacterium]
MRSVILITLAAALALTGCETAREFSREANTRNNEAGRGWLSDQVLPAEFDVSGTWKSAAWGEAFFVQTGRDIRGNLGDYPVEGVVSGKKVCLLARRGGRYDYSIILELPAPGILVGYSSRSIPYEIDDRRDIRLDRK